MKLQSSFIFLKNYSKMEKKERKDDNAIYIDIPRSIYSYITKSFSDTVNPDDENDLWPFQHKLYWEYTDNKVCCHVEFHIYEVAGATYVDVLAEGKNKANIISCLEFIQNTVQGSGIQSDYIMIISYDAVSEYYCNKIYPKLNELERNLRKLLFNIYVVNFDKEYYKATISVELQNKAKGVIQAKGNAAQKEIIRLQEFFYSFEFNDIQRMLFSTSWTEFDIEAKNKFLSDNSDLSALSDEELRSAFANFTPKSDWERFFSKKITGIDFERQFEIIRKYRNSIAHCKFFYYTDYCECNTAIKQLNRAILGAIRETEEKDFSEKNSAALAKATQGLQNSLKQYMKSITENMSKTLQACTASFYQSGMISNSVFESVRTSINSILQSTYKSIDFSGLIPNTQHFQTSYMLANSLYGPEKTEEHSNQTTDHNEKKPEEKDVDHEE